MSRIDRRIVLILSQEESFGFGHIYARPTIECKDDPSLADVDYLTYPKLGDKHSKLRRYSHLGEFQVSCQYDLSNRASAYGFQVEYRDLYRVRRAEAEDMVRGFRKTENGLSAIEEIRGRASDFGEYLTRVAEIIGCNRFAVRSNKIRADGTRYVWLEPSWVRNLVTQLIRGEVPEYMR